MTDVCEVFKQEPNEAEREFKRQLIYFRKTSMQFQHWPLRDLIQFCTEWQEVTGKLLEKGNRPGFEEKFQDAEKRRRFVKELEKRGILKK